MKHTLKIIFTALVLVVTFFSTGGQAKQLPKTARLVPPETLVLVEVNNFELAKQQFEKTGIYKLYKAPAMAAFFKDAKAKWREKINKLDGNNIYRTFFEAETLPQGRVAFALAANEQAQDSNEPTVLLITQWGEKVDRIKEAIARMAQKNIEYGGHQKKGEKYRNVKIETCIDEKGVILNYCFIEDCFIACTNSELIKFVIAHIKGARGTTLAESSDYTSGVAATGPYHDIELYINIKELLKSKIGKDPAGKNQMLAANLGIDNIASLCSSAGFGRETGSSCSGKAFLKVNGSKKGFCRMLEAESAPVRSRRFVPASTYSATFFNLNISKAYNELCNILYNFSPFYAGLMYAPLLPPGPEGEPPLQMKDDIIDHLGSEVIIAQSINKPFSKNTGPTKSLFAVATNNSRALERSLSRLHSKTMAANNPDATRELLGHTIYRIGFQMLPFLQPGIKPMQDLQQRKPVEMFAFSITDTHLIFGTEQSVEQAIRTLSSPGTASIDSKKWFTLAKSAIPSTVGLATLQDNAASAEFFWWLMTEGAKTKSPHIAMGPNPNFLLTQKGMDSFNFNLLPDFETVRKYFGSSACYGLSRENGFMFGFNCLDPKSSE